MPRNPEALEETTRGAKMIGWPSSGQHVRHWEAGTDSQLTPAAKRGRPPHASAGYPCGPNGQGGTAKREASPDILLRNSVRALFSCSYFG
jgi:hypothetical protein